jgi:hypothetical protein
MPVRNSSILRRMKPESGNAITGTFCPAWSDSIDQLSGARMGAGYAGSHLLPNQLVNRIQSHDVGALSP